MSSPQDVEDDSNQLVLDLGGQLFPTSRDEIARTNAGPLLHRNFCGREETKLKDCGPSVFHSNLT